MNINSINTNRLAFGTQKVRALTKEMSPSEFKEVKEQVEKKGFIVRDVPENEYDAFRGRSDVMTFLFDHPKADTYKEGRMGLKLMKQNEKSDGNFKLGSGRYDAQGAIMMQTLSKILSKAPEVLKGANIPGLGAGSDDAQNAQNVKMMQILSKSPELLKEGANLSGLR